MFFRYQQTANLITLDDAFAQLANVLPNGDLAFTFTYTVSPGDVISRGAHTVSVKVLSRYVPVKNLMGDTQPGFVDATSLVNNVRSLLPDAKTAEQQRDKYVIAKTHSDILNSVNSEIVGMLAAQVPPARIPQLNAPKLQLISAQQVKQSNDPQPLLHRVMNSLAVPNVSLQLSASMAASPKALIQDMITRQGLDPSCVLSLTPRAQPEVAVVGGLLVMGALVLLWRSFCELYVAIFRISENLDVLREVVDAERKRTP